MAFGSPGIGHLGVMPIPAAPLGVLKTAFDPGSHAIPGDIRLRWQQIGHDEPALLIALIPPGDQRAIQATGLLRKTAYLTTPAVTWYRRKGRQPVIAIHAPRTRFATLIDAQK